MSPAPQYAWAPAAPVKRKRHGGLWAGGIAVVAVVGIVAASLVLIAPGTAIAGVPVGGLTAAAAAEAVDAHLAKTTVVLTGAGGGATVTGADLGAHVDSEALAADVYENRPMWNPTSWFAGAADADVTLDEEAATTALREAAPSLFTDPVDAEVAYDPASHTYVVTPGKDGTGIDVAAVGEAVHSAFATGETTIDFAATAVPVEPATPTYAADGTAAVLNRMLATAGFYVGDKRVVAIAPDTLASWITLSTDERGVIQIAADPAAMQSVIDTLPKSVNRKAVATKVIANAEGKKLKTLSKGVDGWTLATTDGIATAYAAQLAAGNAAFALTVAIEKSEVVKVERSIEVNLSRQRVYLRENGKVVNSYAVSTGTASHPTFTGTYQIVAKLTMQNMGNPDTKKAPYYYTKNVPWVMYFNGDQALHGAYWHNNFGNVMSHGCVNLPVSVAKYMFDWAAIGTPVWIHY